MFKSSIVLFVLYLFKPSLIIQDIIHYMYKDVKGRYTVMKIAET